MFNFYYLSPRSVVVLLRRINVARIYYIYDGNGMVGEKQAGGAHVVHPNVLYSYLSSRRHVVTAANPSSSLPASSLGGAGRLGGTGGGGFIRYVEDDEDDLSSNDENSDSDRGVGGVGAVVGSGGGVARPGRIGAVTSAAKARDKIPPNARVRRHHVFPFDVSLNLIDPHHCMFFSFLASAAEKP